MDQESYGKIFMRKDCDSEAILINNPDQLARLL